MKAKVKPDPAFDFPFYEVGLIVVIRDNRRNVKERSSTQRFASRSELDRFKALVQNRMTGIEVHEVHLRKAVPPVGSPNKAKEAWCHRCGAWRNYISLEGYKSCEICLGTTADFYWKKFNGRRIILEDTTAPKKTSTTEDQKKERRRLRREKRKKQKELKK